MEVGKATMEIKPGRLSRLKSRIWKAKQDAVGAFNFLCEITIYALAVIFLWVAFSHLYIHWLQS